MMEYIRIQEDFLVECARIYVRTFNSEPWNDHWTEETAFKRLSDIFNTPGFFGIAAAEDGFVKAAIFGNIEQWYEGSMYFLKEMFVQNAYRGSGLGSRLLNKLEENLKHDDVHLIYLFTSEGNRTEGFYKKNAYKKMESMQIMNKAIGHTSFKK